MNTDHINRIAELWRNMHTEDKKLDPVDDKANDKKFKDRKDKDIDNDGDVDGSDKFLHKKRKAIDNEIDGGEKPAKNEASCDDDDYEDGDVKKMPKKKKDDEDDDKDLDESAKGMIGGFTVEIPKQTISGKTIGGAKGGMFVKAKTARQAISMAARRLGVDFKMLRVGKVLKESTDLDIVEKSEAWVLVQNRKIIKKFKTKPSNSAFTSSDNQTLMTVSKAAKMGIKESVELDESMGKLNAKGEIEMTAKNYAKVHKDYKTKIQGVPYAMQMDSKTGGSALYPVKIIKEGKVTMKENAVTHAKHGYGEILQRTDEGVDVMFEHGVEMGMDESELIGILEKSATGSQKQAKNVPGAGGEKHGETASAGEKAFAKGLGKDGESVGTEEEDGVDDINKASRVKGQAPTRGGEPRIGDKAIVKPVTDPAKGK